MESFFKSLGYYQITKINGQYCALMPMIFTVALVVDINRIGYRTRYCYPSYQDASEALKAWDGKGDPPGPWIKQKPEDRLNPNVT